MTTIKWFDRKFDFSFGMEQYEVLYERLQKAPGQYKNTVHELPDTILSLKPNNKWSIKENIGHLSVLEPLWLRRLEDIKEGRPVMTPADLSNTATSASGYHLRPVSALLESFIKARSETLAFIDTLEEKDHANASMHPRLQKPMRIIDLMHFVAEHDDHHLSAIHAIIQMQAR